MIIIKGVVFLLFLLGHIALTSADDTYTDALRSYERQEHRQALQMFDRLATRGDPEALYMLGQMHESGQGTLQDFVEAHKWYNLAAARGHRHATAARDAVATRMTAQQISEAHQAARAWQPRAAPLRAAPEPLPPVETLSGRQLVAEVQRELNRLGYQAGPVDGLMGTRSRNAIRDFQGTVGLAQDGQATPALLARLRQTGREPAATASPVPEPTPARRVALDDDFRDGDYRRNPAWTVLSGRFDIDENGLRSIVEKPQVVTPTLPMLRPDRPEEIGLVMLQLILEQAGGRAPETASPVATEVEFGDAARIFVHAPVDNAFRLEMELASHQRPGSLEMGLFQGNQPGGGYRLIYNPGSRPGLSLVRMTTAGGEVIASSEGTLDLEDGRFHLLSWARDESGNMQVWVDGRRVLQAHDQRLRQGFQGFTLVNHGGDYNLRRVRLEH
ncbi:peptidoglycan-binding protein [Halomonas sp. 328]|uniref:peptidoglycan-binding protein n=1 Tax=Halomonas sp. 328 TaxID=2776704 RepID=UPI0018A7B24C|nr:peptidoglycan-binding protein [Halomonas sp. 328]MBF8221826.1 SEL1-like repeat protein [Halomonas sp. 328]